MKKLYSLYIIMMLIMVGCANKHNNGAFDEKMSRFNQIPILFNFNEYDITSIDDYSNLMFKSNFLEHFPGTKVFITGHADEKGTDKYNLELARNRAETIARFFISRGINPNRITILTYGKKTPIFEGVNPETDRYNRRVETTIVGLNTVN